jgi:hypothetical protein
LGLANSEQRSGLTVKIQPPAAGGRWSSYSYRRYLAAKKSVDDRALNRSVWETLGQSLPASRRLEVLEVGAGIGTMLERMLDWGLLSSDASYAGIDVQAGNIAAARERLGIYANQHGFQVSKPTGQQDGGQRIWRPGQYVDIEWEATDLFDFAAREAGRRTWDLLVAHAFLDLLDVPSALPVLFSLLREGGLFYFSINFDGVTLFEPAIDPDFDEQVQALYHCTMDERLTAGKPSGDSRAGRHLFACLKAAGASILGAGASDWVVFPGPAGYPEDEAYFLHFIIQTIDGALAGHPKLDSQRFATWIAERHAQVDHAELVYIAHQLDFVGIASPPKR